MQDRKLATNLDLEFRRRPIDGVGGFYRPNSARFDQQIAPTAQPLRSTLTPKPVPHTSPQVHIKKQTPQPSHTHPRHTIEQPRSTTTPSHHVTQPDLTKKRRTIAFMGIQTWADFRLVTAGAMLATGLIGFGFYLGLSKPILGLSSEPGSYSEKVQNSEVEIAENGEPVEPGVSAAHTDPRPAPPIRSDMPKKLIIDKIKVNANVRSLGLAKDGSLAVPNSLWQVGWYNLSSKPGQPGTSLFDGHFNGDYGGSAFKDLHKLEPGDEVKVQLGSGEIISYKVTKKDTFSKDHVPMDSLVANDGKERLNLITCGGKWDSKADTFKDRTVIYTERI